MAAKYEDSSRAYDGYSTIVISEEWSQRTNVIWHDGYVTTPHGYVIVSSEDTPDFATTTLSFAHNGRVYTRYFRRYFRPRYLSALAKRFAAEMARQP